MQQLVLCTPLSNAASATLALTVVRLSQARRPSRQERELRRLGTTGRRPRSAPDVGRGPFVVVRATDFRGLNRPRYQPRSMKCAQARLHRAWAWRAWVVRYTLAKRSGLSATHCTSAADKITQMTRSGESPLVAFVSSRMSSDTGWARKVSFEVLNRRDWLTPWLFEQTPASSEPVVESYLSKVRAADLVIWLIERQTTQAVHNEISTALETGRRILMMRITPPPSDPETESLISQVGSKWDFVSDSADLRGKLQAALGDEIVRAWRTAGRSTKRAVLDVLAARSRSRCIDRWLATGLPEEIAAGLADDPSVGLLHIPVFGPSRFALLRGEIGSGKSLTAERLYQDALRRARDHGDERIPIFIEAKNIVGPLEQNLNTSAGIELTHDGISLVVVDGLDEASPDRRIELARAARRLKTEYPSARVLVTSRPIPELSPEFDNVAVDIPPLSRVQTVALIARAAARDVGEQRFWDLSESLTEAVARPLFAILVGLHQRSDEHMLMPRGALLSQLVDASLGRINARRESADPLLRTLARLLMDRGGAPVPISDVSTYAEAVPLLQSRLVVERNGALTFPLTILSEWFAARDLED